MLWLQLWDMRSKTHTMELKECDDFISDMIVDQEQRILLATRYSCLPFYLWLCLSLSLSACCCLISLFLWLRVSFSLSLFLCQSLSLSVCLSLVPLSLSDSPPNPSFFINCLAMAKLFRQVLTESKVSVGGRGGVLKEDRAWSRVCSHGNMMGKVGQGDDFKGSVVLAQGFIYTEIWNFWKQRYWEKWSHKKNGLSSGIEA